MCRCGPSSDPCKTSSFEEAYWTSARLYLVLRQGRSTNRFWRTGGVNGSPPGWPTDEKIEALRAAWFAASDDAKRIELTHQIQQRAFDFYASFPQDKSWVDAHFARTWWACLTPRSRSSGTSKNGNRVSYTLY